ncbi:MAG: thiaminase II [Candidatus Tectomicrobia bacterium]|uniref:Aminopyrimidine aminohydrolase n=1 Tax=Tectimicrobiota bacterium TaxID=2528274 RepID=A0A937VZM5_UNCTE|nr:thiaminase II [Candidatus Tectomicrobia bacterium]
MRFTEQLRQQAAPVRDRVLTHPFVTGIGDGTLPLAAFRYYMCQDYVFLIEYCRVLALAVAKAPDLDTMGRFAALLHATLHTEMALHRDFAAAFGITTPELEATQAAPGTQSYTQHLLSVAYAGSLTDISAALLPCMWDYSEIGQRLLAQGVPASQPLYGTWIHTYAAPEFGALATWLRALLDTLAECASPAEQARLAQIFMASCRYEYRFWDMAYHQETWPV